MERLKQEVFIIAFSTIAFAVIIDAYANSSNDSCSFRYKPKTLLTGVTQLNVNPDNYIEQYGKGSVIKGEGGTCNFEPPFEKCVAGNGIVCKGVTPAWPIFHEKVTHFIQKDITHVWSFTYDVKYTGQIGAVLMSGNRNIKISSTAGDTQQIGLDCWRYFGEYVYYEPTSSTDPYACNLISKKKYFFNIKNLSDDVSRYQLKGM
jgi:hypothetical protein